MANICFLIYIYEIDSVILLTYITRRIFCFLFYIISFSTWYQNFSWILRHKRIEYIHFRSILPTPFIWNTTITERKIKSMQTRWKTFILSWFYILDWHINKIHLYMSLRYSIFLTSFLVWQYFFPKSVKFINSLLF